MAKTAAQLLREIATRDPKAHGEALARGYGVGPLFQDGDRVRLVETPYGSAHEGTLLLSDIQKAFPRAASYGVWTIRHDDGSLFRSEGRLEAL